jgi:hypothetical protein
MPHVSSVRKDVKGVAHPSGVSGARRAAGVAAVVLLVLVTIWWGHRSLSGPDLTPARIQPVNAQYTWLQTMARQCKGDFSQLSPEDQTKVDQASRGWGSRVMHDQWVDLSKH